MTPEEAVPILARWLAETQEDLHAAHSRIADLENERNELQHQVSGFAYWMRTAKTPARIRHLAGHLERV